MHRLRAATVLSLLTTALLSTQLPPTTHANTTPPTATRSAYTASANTASTGALQLPHTTRQPKTTTTTPPHAATSAARPPHTLSPTPTASPARALHSAAAHPAADSTYSPWQPPTGDLDLSADFDPPPQPWMQGHRRVDLGATDAQQILAAGAGTVVFADDLAGRGVVSIAHANGLRTTYEPVDPLVTPGQTVAAGQPIGTLQSGHASCSSAACLHLGLKRGPLYLDPMLLFGNGKVRLLPRPGRPLADATQPESATTPIATTTRLDATGGPR